MTRSTTTKTQDPTTTGRRVITCSQSSGPANRQSGSDAQIWMRSPPLGTNTPKRKDHVTTGSSHEPIRGHQSGDSTEYPVTDIRKFVQRDNENQVPGTLPALTRGVRSSRNSMDENQSQESFDADAIYSEDITYGDQNQQDILDELEKEGEPV